MGHPGYNTRQYRRIAAQLKHQARNGIPVPCAIAGPKCRGVATEPHHIIPLTAGGSWGPENLTPACHPCNIREANRHTRNLRKGRKTTPPAEYYL